MYMQIYNTFLFRTFSLVDSLLPWKLFLHASETLISAAVIEQLTLLFQSEVVVVGAGGGAVFSPANSAVAAIVVLKRK